jgi:DnaK suppressor protein
MRKSPSSHLSATDVSRLRTALLSKRDSLAAAQSASMQRQRGIGDPEAEAGDVAERAIEQDDALLLAAFDATLLAEVEQALAKLDIGGYGISEESGAQIPIERLVALPWARRTSQEETARALRRQRGGEPPGSLTS